MNEKPHQLAPLDVPKATVALSASELEVVLDCIAQYPGNDHGLFGFLKSVFNNTFTKHQSLDDIADMSSDVSPEELEEKLKNDPELAEGYAAWIRNS